MRRARNLPESYPITITKLTRRERAQTGLIWRRFDRIWLPSAPAVVSWRMRACYATRRLSLRPQAPRAQCLASLDGDPGRLHSRKGPRNRAFRASGGVARAPLRARRNSTLSRSCFGYSALPGETAAENK
jgi:hypothetical protein